MGELTTNSFDYSGLPEDTAGKLRYYSQEVGKAKASHILSAIDLGKSILEARNLLAKHGSGTFCKWVEEECGITARTAQNYMRAYEEFGDCETVSQMELSAVYRLAKNDVPKKAKQEAKKLSDKGVVIDRKKADELVEKHTADSGSESQRPVSVGAPESAAKTTGGGETPGPAASHVPSPPPDTITCKFCGVGQVPNPKNIPQELDTVEFREQWALWIQYHKVDRRKALKETTISKQLKKLVEMGPMVAVAAIEQSLENGWIGLFDPRKSTHASVSEQEAFKRSMA